jgi:Flp pilus assembly protein protease CpaA
MDQLSSAAFAFALVGGVHDLLTRKIPNWVTFTGVALGLMAQFWLLGFPGLLDGFLGFALGFALYFPIYAFGYMGAGDVKLLMAVGAWIGWRGCLYVAAGAVVIGAVYALGEIIYRGRLLAVVKNTYSFLRALFVPGLLPEKLKLDHSRKFAFGICIAGAVALLIYLRHSGRLI